ncbi:Scavenger mRNA decapping enzyme C-term binding/HIT domain containing protein [Novymonas esmeraldas]|uniref:Scavenger mRNA decapping enzyme C-term binding/HIT domain containing protein n=1 Tax=Novymonas esmeraldas TaxID=1808958 RepID=A0AAW0ESM6_9TRYP
MAANCIFCKIVAGDIPCAKVAETSKAFAFMDIGPLARGHVLVIPKQHAACLHELDVESAADVGVLLAKTSRAVAGPDGATQYNVLQNNGRLAHQEVPHVHFHVIPKRDAETGLKIGWDTVAVAPDALAEDAHRYGETIDKST